MAGIFAITSWMVWPRASRKRARQPHRSTVADMTCDPARPMAVAISGQDSSLRSTRTLARRRRLAHQGIAQIRVRPAARAGIGGVKGPSAVAAVSHPPTHRGYGAGVDARSAGRSTIDHALRSQAGIGTARMAVVVTVASAQPWPRFGMSAMQHYGCDHDEHREGDWGRVRSGTATLRGRWPRRQSQAAGRPG